jgi:hypothetical protein
VCIKLRAVSRFADGRVCIKLRAVSRFADGRVCIKLRAVSRFADGRVSIASASRVGLPSPADSVRPVNGIVHGAKTPPCSSQAAVRAASFFPRETRMQALVGSCTEKFFTPPV